MKNADTSNLGVLSGFLPFIVVFLVGIFAGWWVVNRYKPCDNPITTNVTMAVKSVNTNNTVKVHNEKKEEKADIVNTGKTQVVFQADLNKQKEYLRKKLSEGKSKNLN